MNSGRGLVFIYRRPSCSPRGADPEAMTADALRGSSGSCGLELLGGSCRAGMVAPAAAGEGSSSGKSLVGCLSCGGHSWSSSTANRRSAGMSALPRAALLRPKKGAQGGQDQKGKGHEVAGFGRWREDSAESILGLGIPGGRPALGEDPRHSGDKASRQARTAPQAGDCRWRFRQHSLAPAIEAAGDRADHPRTAQPPHCHRSGWEEVAPLPAVDRGVNLCLAWAFSAPGGAL